MKQFNEISQTEIRLAFAASCVESVAAALSIPYIDAYSRMQDAQLFDRLIFPHYETLHSESREVVTQRLLEILNSSTN